MLDHMHPEGVVRIGIDGRLQRDEDDEDAAEEIPQLPWPHRLRVALLDDPRRIEIGRADQDEGEPDERVELDDARPSAPMRGNRRRRQRGDGNRAQRAASGGREYGEGAGDTSIEDLTK